eukprot:7648460-Pyramimonas_sp.AAC.1
MSLIPAFQYWAHDYFWGANGGLATHKLARHIIPPPPPSSPPLSSSSSLSTSSKERGEGERRKAPVSCLKARTNRHRIP